MIRVVGVRFKKAGKIYYFDPLEFQIEKNEEVIVETARGMEFGTAVVPIKEVEENEIISPLKPIVRIATEEDKAIHAENRIKADEAFKTCEEKIKSHELDMYLVDVEYTFDKNKLIFYFTAEGRVDFRELVKDLAAIFRTRIELRQIGVRDEAKSIGGLGCCGRPLCCSSWLGEFQPVSIKMAKDQSLSLNPTKISGICGRLFCCLKYEHDNYAEILDKTPDIGTLIETPDGKAKLLEINVILEEVKVQMLEKKEREAIDIRRYGLHEIKGLEPKRRNNFSEKDLLLSNSELKKLID